MPVYLTDSDPEDDNPATEVPASDLAPASTWDLEKADEGRRRKMRTGTVAACVALLVGMGVVGGAVLQFVNKPEDNGIVPVNIISEAEATQGDAVLEDSNSKQTSGSANAAVSSSGETGDLSGQVVYRYVMTPTGNAQGLSVEETVEFGEDGLCDTSTIKATFASQEEASAFVESVRSDYGNALIEAAANGSDVVVKVDVRASNVDREGYEDALRATVQDLNIVSKS